MKWLRCTLTDNDNELTIDVLVDDEKTVIHSYRYFGVWNSNAGEEIFPVIFLPDGNVDYGTVCGPGKDRYGQMALHGQSIFEGALFEYTQGVVWHLRVERCRELGSEANR